MASRHLQHEEHTHHEAWAIPYGDLVTLLLAFFVVMYSISSVNEGKYRTVAKSISSAFNGSKVIEPIQIAREPGAAPTPSVLDAPPPKNAAKPVEPIVAEDGARADAHTESNDAGARARAEDGLATIADGVEQAMAPLIDRSLVVVRRHRLWLEVEIRADILFASGAAALAPDASTPLRELATVLSAYSNPLRVEGYTDNVPIATAAFPSNWELSAARAASVARLFVDTGIDPHRLAIVGLGEFRPEASNATEEGRNRNRRVKLIVLGGEGAEAAHESSLAADVASAAPEMPAAP